MALIKCFECGTMVSEYADACPKCGCPMTVMKANASSEPIALKDANENIGTKKEVSIKEEKNIKRLPIKSFDVDVLKAKKELTEKLEPLTVDYRNTKDVLNDIINYLGMYQEVPFNGFEMIKAPIVNVFNAIIDSNKFRESDRQAKLLCELRKYNNDTSTNKYSGPGFSIITNSFASAAAYEMMAMHDAKKQMRKQIVDANKRLMNTFTQLKNESAIYKSQMEDILQAIDDSIFILSSMSDTSKYLSENSNCYEHKNIAAVLDANNEKGNLLNTLINCYQGKEYVAHIKDVDDSSVSKPLRKYEEGGYIMLYVKYPDVFFFTTGKLEKELIEGKLFTTEKSEKESIEGNAKTSDSNKKCIDDLEIWSERLKKQNVLCSNSAPLALTDRGEVLTSKELYSFGKTEQNFGYEVTSCWKDIIQINRDVFNAWYFGLTADGHIRCGGFNRDRGLPSFYVPKGRTAWSNIKTFCSWNNLVVALLDDGTVKFADCEGNVPAWGQSINTWKDITKIDMHMTTVVGLTSNGSVVLASEESNDIPQVYRNWTGIIDILAKYQGVVAITSDHTLLSTDSANSENVFRLTSLGEDAGWAAIDFDGRICAPSYMLRKVVAGWNNLIDVKECLSVFAGLRRDGTVCVSDRKFDVSNWKDVVQILFTQSGLFGVTKDGRVLCAGTDKYQVFSEIRKWKLFDDFDTTFDIDVQKKNIIKNLLNEKEDLQMKISNLKGLFAAKKRKELEKTIQSIDRKLSELER